MSGRDTFVTAVPPIDEAEVQLLKRSKDLVLFLVFIVATDTLPPSFDSRVTMAVIGRVYEAVSGFFIQDDFHPGTIIDQAHLARFGLLDESPERWIKFRARIAQLNKESPTHTSYKVLFLGRHGEGFHNIGEAKYGEKAWDEYWAKLYGDDEITWGPDAELTAHGKMQAVAARTAWETEVPFRIPLPEKVYCSPLTRALNTNILTFNGVLADETRKIFVVENCREENSEHTSDQRHTRSYILAKFPYLEIEAGFTEEDEMWDPDVRETKEHLKERVRSVLDKIFDGDAQTFISITTHSGIVDEFLMAMGREWFPLPTGGVLPVVVRCRKYPIPN